MTPTSRVGADGVEPPAVARIATNNPGSERVVARLGFTPSPHTDAADAVPHRLWVRGEDAFGQVGLDSVP